MRSRRLILWLCFAVSSIVNPGAFAANDTSGSLGLLQVNIDDATKTSASYACNLEFKSLTTGKDTTAKFERGDHAVFVPLEPGEYANGNLNCNGVHTWMSDGGLFKSVKITAGKLNYIGRFVFHFEKGKNLAVTINDRADAIKGLADSWKEIPAGYESKVVSAYSQMPIAPAMVAPREHFGFGSSVRQKGGGKPVEANDFIKMIQACEKNGRDQDPYMIGKILYVATYKNGKFVDLNKQQNDQSFTPAFSQCLDDSMKQVAVSEHQNFEIKLSF